MIERMLFVVGGQDTGKSVQLRSLFRDPRLGTGGRIPTGPNVRDSYSLSVDRALCLRLTSPHEMNESLAVFLRRTARKTRHGRWCVAAPLQRDRFKKMPELIATIRAILAKLRPERVRVCVLRRIGAALYRTRRNFNVCFAAYGGWGQSNATASTRVTARRMERSSLTFLIIRNDVWSHRRITERTSAD